MVSKSSYSLAVLGATGLIGREILEVLAERRFPVGELRLYDTVSSAGEDMLCGETSAVVQPVERVDFSGTDLAFLAAGEEVSASHAARLHEAGGVAIDLSGLFTDDPDAPTVVPEVNAGTLADFALRGVVASPCPPAVALAAALAPLDAAAGIESIVAVTFEPVSHGGQAGIDELQRQTLDLMSGRSTENRCFRHRSAFNLLPQIGDLVAGGSSQGEVQVQRQLRRILDRPDLQASVTRIQVPVFYGMGIALTVATGQFLGADEARRLLRQAPGILLRDDAAAGDYPMPSDSVGQDAVCVGRIRGHEAENIVDLWLTLDNVRKGAAVNAVQIAELLVRDHL